MFSGVASLALSFLTDQWLAAPAFTTLPFQIKKLWLPNIEHQYIISDINRNHDFP